MKHINEIIESDWEEITPKLRQLFLKEPNNLFEISQLYNQKNIGSILRQFQNKNLLTIKVRDDGIENHF